MNKGAAFKSDQKGLSDRLIFLLICAIIYRLGSHIPVPGIDPEKLADIFHQTRGTILGLFDVFSGNALSRVTIFALGVMPYISASIMTQLFTAFIPSFMQMKKDGDSGRRQLSHWTRRLTLLVACIQALGIAKWLVTQQAVLYPDLSYYVCCVSTLVSGSIFLMWLGEQMTEKGIGNGTSLIIFFGIVSGMPSAIGRTLEQVRIGQLSFFSLLLILFIAISVIGFVVMMERAQRKIAVQYAHGAHQHFASKRFHRQPDQRPTHLPLKINMAGVIPPIFASSLMMFPSSCIHWLAEICPHQLWLSDIALMLSPGHPVYILVFFCLIIFFSFFYTSLAYDPKETSENLKKSSVLIPGIRPGIQTAQYIEHIMLRLTFIGGLYIAVVSLIPEFMMSIWKVSFYFGGTSLLIIVVVVMDLMMQIQSYTAKYRYASFMKKG